MSEAAPTQSSIRPARLEDAALAADILAEAFASDPVMNWTFGGNRAFRTIFFELARGLYLKSGFGHVAGDGAATLWLPADHYAKLPFASELRIVAAAIGASGIGVIGRAKKVSDIMARSHPKEPHYYLFAVGVRDAMKGKGMGGRIIREGLKRAQDAGACAYLENSNPRNTPLYERLGFQAIAPLKLPEGAPPLLGMQTPRAAP